MRKIILLLLSFVLLLSACVTAETSNDYLGTYDLISIDGNPLPYTPAHEGGAPEILSSTLTLNANRTFQMSMIYGTTPGNSISRDFAGVYTIVDESTLRFEWKGAGVTMGTLEPNIVTINNEGLLFAYQK